MEYKTGIAYEGLINNTIGVKTKDGIRKFQYINDIEEDLVYINNCMPCNNEAMCKISKGTIIRYADIYVLPKQKF